MTIALGVGEQSREQGVGSLAERNNEKKHRTGKYIVYKIPYRRALLA